MYYGKTNMCECVDKNEKEEETVRKIIKNILVYGVEWRKTSEYDTIHLFP